MGAIGTTGAIRARIDRERVDTKSISLVR